MRRVEEGGVVVVDIDPDELTSTLNRLTGEFLTQLRQIAPQAHLQAVIDQAAGVLQVECVGVLLLDTDQQPRRAATTGPAAAALESAQQQLRIGPGIDVLASDSPIAVRDLADHHSWQPLATELVGAGVRAVLAAPIRVGGRIVGNLNAVAAHPRRWAPDTIAAAQAFADIVGVLLALLAATTVPPSTI